MIVDQWEPLAFGMVIMGIVWLFWWLARETWESHKRDRDRRVEMQREARLQVLRGEPVMARLFSGVISDEQIVQWEQEASAIRMCASRDRASKNKVNPGPPPPPPAGRELGESR